MKSVETAHSHNNDHLIKKREAFIEAEHEFMTEEMQQEVSGSSASAGWAFELK